MASTISSKDDYHITLPKARLNSVFLGGCQCTQPSGFTKFQKTIDGPERLAVSRSENPLCLPCDSGLSVESGSLHTDR